MIDTFFELLVCGYGQFMLIGDPILGGEYSDLKTRRALLENIENDVEPLIPYEVASGDQISFFVACFCLFLVLGVLPSIFYYVIVACD